jgi:surface polysaccharide O-acyltransferase-like enzyme
LVTSTLDLYGVPLFFMASGAFHLILAEEVEVSSSTRPAGNSFC